MDIDTDRAAVIHEVIARYFRTLHSRDEEAWIAAHAPGATVFAPVGAEPVFSREGLRLFFRGLTSAFEQLSVDPDHMWLAPDGAAVKWTGHAVARNGDPIVFEGIDVFEVDDLGRIRTVWSYFDPACVLDQIDD